MEYCVVAKVAVFLLGSGFGQKSESGKFDLQCKMSPICAAGNST
jgi:hypothetical protein